MTIVAEAHRETAGKRRSRLVRRRARAPWRHNQSVRKPQRNHKEPADFCWIAAEIAAEIAGGLLVDCMWLACGLLVNLLWTGETLPGGGAKTKSNLSK